MAGAPKGNKNRVALKDPEIRQIAYHQYCDHIASGFSKMSWRFRHADYPDYNCTWETMDKYMADNPIEFPPIHFQKAMTDSFQHWEKVIAEGATGENPDVNPACLQMIMRNRFKWDKIDHEHIATCAADKILERINNKGS